MHNRRFDVVIPCSDLKQRTLTFCCWDFKAQLDSDTEWERATKRHKFRVVKKWNRLDSRNNTMERREVPTWCIEGAIKYFRSTIEYEGRDE